MTNVTLTTEQAQQIEEAVCNAITSLREALDHISASGKPIDGQAKKAIFFSKCPKCKYAVSSMDAGAVWWCPSCKTEWPFEYEVPVKPEHDGHWSDCSVHNEPAYPNGECDFDTTVKALEESLAKQAAKAAKLAKGSTEGMPF